MIPSRWRTGSNPSARVNGSSSCPVRSSTVDAEHRPIAQKLPASGQPQLFLVAQILDRRRDVAVEPQIADLGIGQVGADGEVDLVAAEREIVLVDAEAMGDVDERPKRTRVRPTMSEKRSVRPGAVGKQARFAGQAIALPDVRLDRPFGPVERPVRGRR